MNRRNALIAVVTTAVVLAVGFPTFVGLITDWYWFQSVGYQSVFLKSIGTRTAIGLVVGLGTFAFLFANLWYAQRGLVPHPMVFSIEPGRAPIDLFRTLRRLVWPVSLGLSVLVALSATGTWLTLLSFFHRTPFGVADPIFQRDLQYYFFTLPAATAVLGLITGITILTLIIVVPLYVLRGDVVLRRRIAIEPSAQIHLAILIALLFVATATTIYFVRIPSLLYAGTDGRFVGASYADLAVRLPFFRVSAVIALLAALAVLVGAWQRQLPRNLLVAAALYILVGLAATGLAAAVHRFAVLPNELARETPQLRHHIDATRRAWGLDKVEVRDLSGEAQLTLADIRANGGTIKNVRLWDRDPLLQTFSQLQEIRTYYDFVSVDDDRYVIDGEYRQVLLSPRELNPNSLPTRNFINERLTFTHGMGVTLSPVNQVTEEGLPVLFIKDLPPSSSVSLTVKRPGIYFGELSSDYVFVNTGQPEFDYPSGEGNMVSVYQGTGGVRINSLVRRAILSVRFRSFKILLSDDIQNDSRILYHRNISERAAKALPFLRWDADPYIVIRDDGRLQWILDAYTASNRYPYAQRLGPMGLNYLRNSVKVVIDAYDGTIEAYIAEPDDPLIRTYAAAFGGIFRPITEMPEDLRRHVRYPEDVFRAQTALYATYHMSEPEVFFHREDQWQSPTQARGNDPDADPFLRHIVMKLPGEEKEEFIEMAPFTPRQKDNLAAWMVARNDGEHYGKLIVYRFPRQSLVFGPTQVLNRINQNPEIARQISLWDQRGSEVIRGNLLVIPIEESLIFVQALYLRAQGGRIPELQRVIVAYRNQVVMEETLDEALARLFGGPAGPPTSPPRQERPLVADDGTANGAALARQAAAHYDRAIAAQRIGDWTTYGAEIARVGELLKRLAAAP